MLRHQLHDPTDDHVLVHIWFIHHQTGAALLSRSPAHRVAGLLYNIGLHPWEYLFGNNAPAGRGAPDIRFWLPLSTVSVPSYRLHCLHAFGTPTRLIIFFRECGRDTCFICGIDDDYSRYGNCTAPNCPYRQGGAHHYACCPFYRTHQPTYSSHHVHVRNRQQREHARCAPRGPIAWLPPPLAPRIKASLDEHRSMRLRGHEPIDDQRIMFLMDRNLERRLPNGTLPFPWPTLTWDNRPDASGTLPTWGRQPKTTAKCFLCRTEMFAMKSYVEHIMGKAHRKRLKADNYLDPAADLDFDSTSVVSWYSQ